MKKKLLIYGLGLAAVIAIWVAWYAMQPQAHEIRATRTFVQVNAPADRVWQALTELPAYPEWNPYVIQASGDFAEGSTLHIKEKVGGRTHRHSVKVVKLRPQQRTFTWAGALIPGRFLHWEESFQVEAMDPNHSLVTVSRAYQGWLLPLYWKVFNKYDLEAIRQMGAALKSRCEK